MDQLITHFVVEGFLLAYIVFGTLVTLKERKNLLDRIMASSFQDYHTAEMNTKKASIPPKVVRKNHVAV